MARLTHYLSNLGGSFWFVPSLIVIASMLLAVGLIEIDTAEGYDWMDSWPRVFGVGAEGARGMLAMIGGSIVTVVGVTFSMTLMTLTLASSQYTSRVLRNFMKDRVTQVVLGVFAGIFVYCLIVLRTIRDSDDGDFIPRLSVAVSMVLALGGIGVLIFFIHHIASAIQASSIISSVAGETFTAVDRLFPDELGQDDDEEVSGAEQRHVRDLQWIAIPVVKDGYIQHVDNALLLRLACEHDTVVRMERGIGEFVRRDAALVSLAMTTRPHDESLADSLRACFAIDRYRTLEQDAAFGIRQLVDIALRALSPSTNDTTTAVMCVDYLTAILTRLAPRKIPSAFRYHEGALRVIAAGPTFSGLLSLAFDQIRLSAEGNPALLMKLVDALEAIATCTLNIQRRQITAEILDDVAEAGRRTLVAPPDRLRFEQHLGLVTALIHNASARRDAGEMEFIDR